MNIDTSRITFRNSHYVGPVVLTLPGGPSFDAVFKGDPAGYDHALLDVNAASSRAERRQDARRGFRGRRGAVRIARMPDTDTVSAMIDHIVRRTGF